MFHILGNHKLKPQGDTTSYLLEYLKLKRLTMASVREDMEEFQPSYTSGRNIKWYNQFGKQLGSFL